MNKQRIISLHIVERSPHASELLQTADNRRIGFWRHPSTSPPASAVLKIDDADAVTGNNSLPRWMRRLLTQLRLFSKTCGP